MTEVSVGRCDDGEVTGEEEEGDVIMKKRKGR